MLMRAATVVQQLCKSCRTCFKFYCMFYFTCERSFTLYVLYDEAVLTVAVQIEAAKVLLRYGADVNIQCPPRFDRRRAIDFAVMVGSSELTELLLEAGASLSLSVGYSLTPLDSAVVHDRPDVCRLMLSHRADPNEVNADGCTALQVRLVTSQVIIYSIVVKFEKFRIKFIKVQKSSTKNKVQKSFKKFKNFER